MSNVSAIPAAATPTPSAPKSSALPTSTSTNGQTLTQQDFLKIMVAQFTQQDPLASGDSSGGNSSGTSDYVNELMSMTNLTTMQTMSSQQSVQLMGMLPGSTVQLNNNGAAVNGTVSGTSLNNGSVYVTVNGTSYPVSDLISVTQSAAQAAQSAAGSAAPTAPTTSTTSN